MSVFSRPNAGEFTAIERPDASRAALRVGSGLDDLDLAAGGLASESHERWQRIQAALSDLRDGYKFALSLGRDVWDFAVEIDGLQQRGLRANELRWLIFKGWIAHAHESTSRSSDQRCFTEGGPARFDKTSCFALTPAGADVLYRWRPGPPESRVVMDDPAPELMIPRWDQERQELWLAQYLIKRFKVPANTQGMVLCAFEEEKWAPRIDDPLPGNPELDRKRRLHNTINALNRNQIHPWVRFLGDGRGQGIRWELRSQSPWLKTG